MRASRVALAIALAGAAALGAACGGPKEVPPPSSAEKLNAEGLRRLERGDELAAEDLFRDAIGEAELVDDLKSQAEAWNNRGALAYARGRLDEAYAFHSAALRAHAQRGVRDVGEVRTRTNLAAVLLAYGRRDDARRELEEAKRLAATVKEPAAAMLPRIGLASLALSDGDPRRAADEASAAAADARKREDKASLAAALSVDGMAHEALGDHEGAESRLAEALAVDRVREVPESVATDLRALARVAEARGEAGKASAFHGRAARVARRLGQMDVATADLTRAIALGQQAKSADLPMLMGELDALQAATRTQARASADGGAAK